jgi:signal-transduction protein with cAMP-binding, CBS, and nucleotidyltransferase domain
VRLRRNAVLVEMGNNLPAMERKVVKSLSKPIVERTPQENREMMPFFLAAACFKSLEIQPSDLYKVVQKMEFKRLDKDEVIFNYGDEGDYFYILIYGKVQLLLPNPEIAQL